MKLSIRNFFYAITTLIGTAITAEGAREDWSLIFQDEFSSDSFDTDGSLKWNTEGGHWNKIDYVNWGVADWRKYQSRDDAMVTQGDGYVTLKGSYGDYTSQSDQSGASDTFACGGIFTDKTFTFQYGYVEVRARFESAKGVWPAIWMMPKNGGEWLTGGEIDIMEHLNQEGFVHQTLHLYDNTASKDAAPTVTPKPSIADDVNGWHTYGMEWTRGVINFYVDGTKTGTFSSSGYTYWPYDKEKEFYLLIDQQIGGSWPGEANSADLSKDSVDFDIDYVRVYEAPAAYIGGWNVDKKAPADEEGNILIYTDVSGKTTGDLSVSSEGNHAFTVSGNITGLTAADSNICLATNTSNATVTIDNVNVSAQSLYIADGGYKLSGSTALNVDTLYVAGGHLDVSANAGALVGISKIYLGMEDTDFNNAAARKAALHFNSDQRISANIELIDDSKMTIYKGYTVVLDGDINTNGYTLNITGRDSQGVANVHIGGVENDIGRLSLGVSETTASNNEFPVAGQTLAVSFTGNSKTKINELVTNSPAANLSSMTVKNGAVLTIDRNWKNASATNSYNVTIDEGGVFNLGNGTDAASATELSGVSLTTKGTFHLREKAEMTIDSLTVSAADNAANKKAALIVDGKLTATTLNLHGGAKAIGVFSAQGGHEVNIGTIALGGNGETNINVADGTLAVTTLTTSSQALVINAEQSCKGTFRVTDKVDAAGLVQVRYGSAEFQGGMSGSGTLQIKNNATATVNGSAGSRTVNIEENATLKTAGDFSGATVTGSGTVQKTDSGTAHVTVGADFSGSLRAEAGEMQVSGITSLVCAAAKGGALTLQSESDTITVQRLLISDEGRLATEASILVSNGGSLTAVAGTIAANLTLADGSSLNITCNEGLRIEGCLTLGGIISLGDTLATPLSLTGSTGYTLATGLQAFMTGEHAWTDGETALASKYFSSETLNLDMYQLSYRSAETGALSGGSLSINLIPEPTSATLSLLALAGLAARRRRK